MSENANVLYFRCLGLDLVVRDDNGNILNPDITSAVKLFRHHDEAAAAIRKVPSSMPNVSLS